MNYKYKTRTPPRCSISFITLGAYQRQNIQHDIHWLHWRSTRFKAASGWDNAFSQVYGSYSNIASPFDFVSVHAYNNEWSNPTTSSSSNFIYQYIDVDIAWANNNGRPYVFGEFGFNGAMTTSGCPDPYYPGGQWGTTTIPNCQSASGRVSAYDIVMHQFINQHGCDGIMVWGLIAPGDIGGGISCQSSGSTPAGGDNCNGIGQSHNDWDGMRELFRNFWNSPPPPTGMTLSASDGTYPNFVFLRVNNVPPNTGIRFYRDGQPIFNGLFFIPEPGENFLIMRDYTASATSSANSHNYTFDSQTGNQVSAAGVITPGI